MSSAICFNLDQSKILSSGNGLNHGVIVIKVLVKHFCLSVHIIRSIVELTIETSICSMLEIVSHLKRELLHARVVLDSATRSTICEQSNGISNQVWRIFCLEHAPSTPRSKVVWSGVVTSSTWREPKQYARNCLWQWRSLYATHVSLEQVDSILYTV